MLDRAMGRTRNRGSGGDVLHAQRRNAVFTSTQHRNPSLRVVEREIRTQQQLAADCRVGNHTALRSGEDIRMTAAGSGDS